MLCFLGYKSFRHPFTISSRTEHEYAYVVEIIPQVYVQKRLLHTLVRSYVHKKGSLQRYS
jgi:hypothetical protein